MFNSKSFSPGIQSAKGELNITIELRESIEGVGIHEYYFHQHDDSHAMITTIVVLTRTLNMKPPSLKTRLHRTQTWGL